MGCFMSICHKNEGILDHMYKEKGVACSECGSDNCTDDACNILYKAFANNDM